MNIERLEWHLENWRDYMMRDTSKLGYPSRSMMLQSGNTGIGINQDAFDMMCDGVDADCAIKMESLIDSISQPQRTAINHVWLSVPHHYPTQELDYDEAITSLCKLADKRGLL